MSVVLNGLSIVIPIMMSLLWVATIFLVNSLPFTKRNRNLKIKSRIVYWTSILSISIGVLWLLLIVGTWIFNGWIFVEGIVKAIVPLVLLGNLPVLMLALPQLRQLTGNHQGKLSVDTKIKASNPKLIIPFLAAMLSSGLNFYLQLFAQPIDPSLLEALSWPLILLLLLFIPSFFIIRKYERAKEGQDIWLTGWKRWIKSFSIIGMMILLLISIFVVNVQIGINTSKLPPSSDMMNHDNLDEGGGSQTMQGNMMHHSPQIHNSMVEVKNLQGETRAPADKKFTLVAQQKTIVLQSGKKINAWTYNGQIAPQLHVKEGEMIEIKLINRDITKGVTIHWHGYNVPNAMDGVPGMTQNVVKPGGTFIYKFRANQIGTYWFHSHQQAAEQVKKGLFGSFIVEPKEEVHPYDVDATVINHRWRIGNKAIMAFGNDDQEQKKHVKPGQKIRVRVINGDNLSRKYFLSGADFQVTSIDGIPIKKPERLPSHTSLQIAAGGRYDLTFIMPKHPVQLGMSKFQDGDEPITNTPSLLFDTGFKQVKSDSKSEKKIFDPAEYGTSVQNKLTKTQKFDREFYMIMGNRMGFYDGKLNYLWTINGEVYPKTPTFVVKQGDLVKVTFVNRSLTEHPMHLHGHHMTVLKKNGQKVRTPWQTDTLNVQMGETYEVAFIADNPGMWMDHCHNLDHAAVGMTLHLMYDNVMPSFEVGTKSGNIPD
ncbi:Multicopper oxidase with three cupredoxin domains (includes cell division protein FtsP and spore coat protein CotA) [Seinonella peptonophila]|uniref:Multicopper oxidase with three cupredoxin domains (Includes cell division protein FtsP and spore coat protein CotA) n=1 Tax=Seinonella peptonophila TaxID=112248 RepID=A0A1M4U0G2_9BACL|nr:multicopper oxidase family protein [Seinonella peptonophila]SHE50252.1 Multicopper oxidase with three cupredoxin domains (includes cell division protein FtsP and spore coat protein CotA) [Seinonella peptonophila]